jgi:hypothetical protein
MFNEVDADIYVMVDGDDTYDASAAPALIDCLLKNNCAMVVGRRVHHAKEAYRPAHVFGNALLSGMIGRLFGNVFTDVLSGYRVFTRQFVKSFPLLTGGFELETELTVHALGLRLPVRELDTEYGPRPAGSASKLATWRDGYKIFWTILTLLARPHRDPCHWHRAARIHRAHLRPGTRYREPRPMGEQVHWLDARRQSPALTRRRDDGSQLSPNALAFLQHRKDRLPTRRLDPPLHRRLHRHDHPIEQRDLPL